MRNERVSMNFFDIGSYYLRSKMWKLNKFICDWTPKIVGKYFTQITQNFVHFRRLAFCADVDIQAKKKFELTHICLIFESVLRILTENSYIVFKKLILNILMSCYKKFNLLFSLLWTKYQSIPGPRGQGTPSGNEPPPYFLETEYHPPKRAQGNKPENVCGFASYCLLIRYH